MPPKDVEILKMMSSMEFQLQNWACALCDKEITESVKIVSAVNSGNGKLFVYCLNCLKSKKSAMGHSPQDAYYVMDRLNFPLFSSDFSAREELALLQGLMKMGMDNFTEIADQHLPGKDPKKCEAHYYSFYYKSNQDPLPAMDTDQALIKRYDRGGPVIDQQRMNENDAKEKDLMIIKKRRAEEENKEMDD